LICRANDGIIKADDQSKNCRVTWMLSLVFCGYSANNQMR